MHAERHYPFGPASGFLTATEYRVTPGGHPSSGENDGEIPGSRCKGVTYWRIPTKALYLL